MKQFAIIVFLICGVACSALDQSEAEYGDGAAGDSVSSEALSEGLSQQSDEGRDFRELDDTNFPVTFEAGGRRENSYSLVFDVDVQICSAVLEDLNLARQADVPLNNISKATKSTWQDVVIGTRYSIEWTELAMKNQRYYREGTFIDIDNDGKVEQVYRISDETKYGKTVQELFSIEVHDDKLAFITEDDPQYHTESEVERIIGEPVRNENGFILYYPNAVRLDNAESAAEGFGSFVDVVSIHGKQFILSGGTNPYEVRGAVTPIWLFSLSEERMLNVLCKIQSNLDR